MNVDFDMSDVDFEELAELSEVSLLSSALQ